MKASTKERFWSKVDIRGPEDCWNWLAYTSEKGYGSIKIDGKALRASIVAWELTNGFRLGKQVLHKCDNKRCVNPNHLYLGTAADNIHDREKRNPVSRELSGITHTKFCAYEIHEIRRLRGKSSQRDIAKIYNVAHSTIGLIWRSDKFLCKEGYYA